MRETQVPRGMKVVFWVDDNPQNNLECIWEFEKTGILTYPPPSIHVMSCRYFGSVQHINKRSTENAGKIQVDALSQ